MGPKPEASDQRAGADDTLRRADKPPPGRKKQSLLDKAEDYEAEAHSNDWRHSHLHAPD